MRGAKASGLAVLAVLIAAPSAGAVTVSTGAIPLDGGGELIVLLVAGEAGEGNRPSFEYNSGDNTRVFVVDPADATPTAGGDCQAETDTNRIECPTSPGGKPLQALIFQGNDGEDELSTPNWMLPIIFSGGIGADQISMTAYVDLVFDGGEGNDVISIGQGGHPNTHELSFDLGPGNDVAKVTSGQAVEILGGPGTDEIITGDVPISDSLYPVAATIDGGEGDDDIAVGDGKDTVRGGAGTDIVRYSQFRRDPGGVTVTLDDAADDGRAGEGDLIDGTGDDAVENVQVNLGVGPTSKIVGNDSPNDLRGENVDLEGRGGDDVLIGGDTTRQERIDGGPGNDNLVGGFGPDLLIGGEGVDSFSGDRTQANVVATGDDRIEARDGNVEQIGCGVGADVVIADAGDVTGSDCESVDRPAAAPGGGPGTGGSTGPGGSTPAATLPQVAGRLGFRFRRIRGGWLLARLDVTGVTSGATVEVRCRGRGCPFARRRFPLRSGRATATRAFRRKRLRAGVVIEIRITAPNRIGRVFRLTVRRRGAPRRTALCLPPGAARPQAC